GVPGRKAQQSGHPTTRQPGTAPHKPRAADNAPRSGNAPQAQTATPTAGTPTTWEAKFTG
ncbi:hypothetical protein ACFU90_36225, partial [Streptomyces noursei]|uniref:hypothetical protein n=1 Tax=Streptomyces noursei TaxID=1971 RepID=UPI00368E5933